MLNISCSAYQCSEKYVKNSSVTFHSFPDDPERRKIWIAALKINGFICKPYSKLCSNHFTHDSFDWDAAGRKWLKPTAVPSIFHHPPPNSEQSNSSAMSTPLSLVPHDSGNSNMFANQDLKENKPPSENRRQMEEDETASLPTRVQKRLRAANNIIRKQKKKIAMLQFKNHQLQKKIALLTEIIISLKKKDVYNLNESSLEVASEPFFKPF